MSKLRFEIMSTDPTKNTWLDDPNLDDADVTLCLGQEAAYQILDELEQTLDRTEHEGDVVVVIGIPGLKK